MVIPKIILASSSPRRKALLEQVGLVFEVIPSAYEENMELTMSPYELVKHLAYNKAKDVAQMHPDAIVIGADTFAVFNNKPIGKPHTVQKAQEILTLFSGKTHEFVTGVSIVYGKKEKIDFVSSKVTFRTLSSDEIDEYIKKDDILEIGGAYKIHARGALLVEKIEGDYCNIVGLPLVRLAEMLLEFNVRLL